MTARLSVHLNGEPHRARKLSLRQFEEENEGMFSAIDAARSALGEGQ